MDLLLSLTTGPEGPPPAPQMWHFDILSAVLGAAVTFLLIGLGYGLRDPLSRVWEPIARALDGFRQRLQASAEERYREMVADWACRLNVANPTIPPSAVFIEPDLRLPPPIPPSTSEIDLQQVERHTQPLHQTLSGYPRLVILGQPGTGRTTALAYVALSCVTQTEMEEGSPSAEPVESTGPRAELPPSVRERLPLYVPLPMLDWGEGSQEERGQDEALTRLVDAALTAVGAKGRSMAAPVRESVAAGRAVVLADGWDELPSEQRRHVADWLTQLDDAMPGNLWVVGAGLRGHAPLVEAGFIPLTLEPWDVGRVEAFARRWVEACTESDDRPSTSPHTLAGELRRAWRAGASPMELALRAVVILSDHRPPTGRTALFNRALEILLWQEGDQEAAPWLLAACRAALGRVALDLQQERRALATREEIEAAIEDALPPPRERSSNAPDRIFRALTGERGLLRPLGPRAYTFAHPLWRAYLAARQMVTADPETLAEHLDDPHWKDALRFYAELGDMGPLVTELLSQPEDIFYTHLDTLSSWVGVAPNDAAWRNGAMAVLARAFLRPDTLPPARRSLAAALSATNTPGVAYFFKQALQQPDAGPSLRAAAVLGLGRVIGEDEISALEGPLEDEDPVVRRAAVRALASLGTDAAEYRLEEVLAAGDEATRPLAAELLVSYRKESMDVLRKMAKSEDVMTRRAAVSGLKEAGARGVLQEMAREDEQWVVRSAATAALEELDAQEENAGLPPPPQIEQLPWLISWAAAHGESVGLGAAAHDMLRRALQQGEGEVRLLAAKTLAQFGGANDVEILKAALDDPEPVVAQAAFDALETIGRRYDLTIAAA